METLGSILLICGAIILFGWLTLRRLGIGQTGGKLNCGCGSGRACKSGKVQP